MGSAVSYIVGGSLRISRFKALVMVSVWNIKQEKGSIVHAWNYDMHSLAQRLTIPSLFGLVRKGPHDVIDGRVSILNTFAACSCNPLPLCDRIPLTQRRKAAPAFAIGDFETTIIVGSNLTLATRRMRAE
jgi:hypothetical protein